MENYFGHSTPRVRRFAVTIDGVRHEVVVEELDPIDEPPTGTVSSTYTASPGAATDTDASDMDISPDGWVVAPMPGTVTEVAVSKGERVNSGDVLVILTAMKLENEITAPVSGVVRSVAVNPGDNVTNGDPLVQLSVEGDNS